MLGADPDAAVFGLTVTTGGRITVVPTSFHNEEAYSPGGRYLLQKSPPSSEL